MARVKVGGEESSDSSKDEQFLGYMATSEDFDQENYRLSMNERASAYGANRIPQMDIGSEKEA